MKNIGLDFYLLSDRISGSFDFFRNDITRLLGYASTSPLAIYETRPVNGGHYYRRGWELMLDTKNIVGEFTWNTSCLLYTSPSPRDRQKSRMPSSA